MAKLLLLAVLAFTLICSSVLATAAEHNLETWMKGRDITLVVTFRAGGGHDLTARMISKIGPKYFPGKPRILVKNLPGGQGLRGLRYAYIQKPDGLTASQLHPQFLLRPLIGFVDEGFDPSKIRIVGNLLGGSPKQMLCVRRSVATSWDEVLKLGRTITFGDTSFGSSGGAGAMFLQLIGAPVKVVTGYDGTAGIVAALDRSELDSGRACLLDKGDTIERLQPEWVKPPAFLVPIAYYGEKPDAARLRELGLKMPPLIFDLPGIKYTKAQRDALELNVLLTAAGNRSVWLPPGSPDDMFAAWSHMIKSLATDQEFINLAQAGGQEVAYVPGAELDRILKLAAALPDEGKTLLRRLNTGK
jgi:tripartite-type tricarboxylate transporter receptor subunit TctC